MHAPRELPHIAADVLARIRAQRPRVHCITNSVAQNFTANMLLAAGAVPSMTLAVEEIADFVAGADALLVNLGTLDPERRAAIDLADYVCGGSAPELEAYIEWLRQRVLGFTGRGPDFDVTAFCPDPLPFQVEHYRQGDERFWAMVTALAAAVDEAIAAHPDVAEKIRGGKVAAAGALVGAVMKATQGKADASRVKQLILDRLGQA